MAQPEIAWTTEQVRSFAPDNSTAAKADALAKEVAWASLSKNEHVFTGVCTQGSRPYEVAVQMNKPAFQCSCPSRKRPCKHAIGLFLLAVQKAELFMEAATPKWVRPSIQQASQKTSAPKDGSTGNGYVEKAKANTSRMQRMHAGAQELKLWLSDVMRSGLAALSQQPESYWEDLNSRLTDFQIAGLKRYTSATERYRAHQTDWVAHMLRNLSEMHLLITAFEHLDDLDMDMQALVLQQLGVHVRQSDISEEKQQLDHWLCLGSQQGEDENLQFLRTWYWAHTLQAFAFELVFAFGQAPLPTPPRIGTVRYQTAQLMPGYLPLRIGFIDAPLVSNNAKTNAFPLTHQLFSSAQASISALLAKNPWAYIFPVFFESITPVMNQGVCHLIDSKGKTMPVNGQANWKLLSISGGHPIHIFGTFGDQQFLPLTVYSSQRWIEL